MRINAVFLCCIWTLFNGSGGVEGSDKTISRIALGSCAKQNRPQPIWDAIVQSSPDLFLFLGDNIYGDTDDMAILRAKYRELGSQPGFQKLRAVCPILATWDDHDYGVNDGGADYARKAESQEVFNDFFDTPKDSPRRARPGIYDAQVFGPPGQRVQIILLDTRYFRSPLVKRPEADRKLGPYQPNEDPHTTILGDSQWNWLEEQLRVPAELRIVASSIQVVADEHHWEKWGNMPHERNRLFELIRKNEANGVIFVSGDRHLAEISCIENSSSENRGGYPLYDLTSSSLNQPSGGGNDNEPNAYRLGDNYLQVNFGAITIDWRQTDPVVELAIHGLEGEVVQKQAIKLSQLRHQ